MSDVYAAIDAHLGAFWQQHRPELQAWSYGPIWRSLPRFRVLRLAPTSKRDPWL